MLIKSPAPCQLVWAGHGIRSDWRPKEASKTHITTLCCRDLDKGNSDLESMRTLGSLLTNRRTEYSVVSSENGNDPGKCRPVS